MKLLHLQASPRGAGSTTLPLAQAFLDGLKEQVPDLAVDHLDLFGEPLPEVAGRAVDAKYALSSGGSPDAEQSAAWRHIEVVIERFLAADAYLLSVPMWNFGIPYVLKHYIDCIVQPGYLFRFGEQGPVPLVTGRRMVVVTSRGSDYSAAPLQVLDFQEPYLRSIFGFVGLGDIVFVNAEPVDITPDLRAAAVREAVARARSVGADPSWAQLSRRAASRVGAESGG